MGILRQNKCGKKLRPEVQLTGVERKRISKYLIKTEYRFYKKDIRDKMVKNNMLYGGNYEENPSLPK